MNNRYSFLITLCLLLVSTLVLQSQKFETKFSGVSIPGINKISSVNNFANKIELLGSTNGAMVYHPGQANELMFGMHNNGNFYWGTGKSATKPNFYSMILNGRNGDLNVKGKLNVVGRTIFDDGIYAGGVSIINNKLYVWDDIILNSSDEQNIDLYNGTIRLRTLASGSANENKMLIVDKNGFVDSAPIPTGGNGGGNDSQFWSNNIENGSPAGIYMLGSDSHPNDKNIYIGKNRDGVGYNTPPELSSKVYLTNENDEMLEFNRWGFGGHNYVFKFGMDGNLVLAKRNNPGSHTDKVVWEVDNGNEPGMNITGKLTISTASGAPDYVFTESYKSTIPSLSELEKFIELNSHLPGVKDAVTFQKEGFDVVKDGFAMLEKIEELTLYTIAQEKKIIERDIEMQSLKKQIAVLQEMMHKALKLDH